MITDQIAQKIAMARIADVKNTESAVRDLASGNVSAALARLFPGASADFQSQNGIATNEMALLLGRVLEALRGGSVAWDGDTTSEQDALLSRLITDNYSEMLGLVVTQSLVGGRFALMPYRVQPSDPVRIAVLGGFVYPIFAAYDALLVEKLVQIQDIATETGVKYHVTTYEAGKISDYGVITDWKEYTTKPAKITKTTYTEGMPVVFSMLSRNANGDPEGILAEQMDAVLTALKAATEANARAGAFSRPQRVVISDSLAQIARQERNNPVLDAFKTVSPNTVLFVDSQSSVATTNNDSPIDSLTMAQALLSSSRVALRLPITAGTNLSGEALQEMRYSFNQMVGSIASALGAALTKCLDIIDGLGENTAGINVSVTLGMSEAERTAAIERTLKMAGIVPQSVLLAELQRYGVMVTDEQISAAEANETAELGGVVAGNNTETAE